MPVRLYARRIEAAWTKLLERPAVLGERDWALICDWHARSIPIALVHEAMEALGEKLRRRRHPPRNLGALAPLVDAAWHTVREGRISGNDPGEGSAAPLEDPERRWRRCAESRPAADPLRILIENLLERLESGAARDACDADLAAGLLERLSATENEVLTAAVDAELAAFRDRMEPATWTATRQRALISTARRRLGLPRLTGP